MARKPFQKLQVVYDTREQRPWNFDPALVEVVRATLHRGDYSIVGLEQSVVIERKSLGDLVGTVIHEWLRFRKKLNWMGGCDMAVIAVEADISQLWAGNYESDAEPASVFGKCNACLIDHGVPVLFWGDAEHAAKCAYRLLHQAERKYRES